MARTKNQVLEEYIKFRSLKSKTKRALEDIKFHINKFIKSSRKPLKDFDESILLNYMAKITPEYKTSMLNTIKSSYIKNFIKWYFDDYSSRFRNLDSILKTEQTGETYKPEQMISLEDFEKLIKGEESFFWKAYFLTLFYSGSRPVEVCGLKWEDVEFEEDGCFVKVYSNKNKKSFLKFVPSNVSFYLQKLKDNGSEYVFYNSKTKKPVGVKGAYWKLGVLSKKVLGKKINLYLLRHSIATINYNKDDIKDDNIALQMGHSKSMKRKYVHNDILKLKENAKKIYIQDEDIPEEKKHKLEKQVEELKRELDEIREHLHFEFENKKPKIAPPSKQKLVVEKEI